MYVWLYYWQSYNVQKENSLHMVGVMYLLVSCPETHNSGVIHKTGSPKKMHEVSLRFKCLSEHVWLKHYIIVHNDRWTRWRMCVGTVLLFLSVWRHYETLWRKLFRDGVHDYFWHLNQNEAFLQCSEVSCLKDFNKLRLNIFTFHLPFLERLRYSTDRRSR